MPWRSIVGLGAIALLALALGAGAEEPKPVAPSPPAPSLPAASRANTVVAEQSEPETCPSQCQTQHDRCRVQTKGSPSCDAERQACLQKCISKKKK